MRLPPSVKLELSDHWISTARGPGDQELPPTVRTRWVAFSRQSRRSRNGYFVLEGLALVSAAAVPASVAIDASLAVPAVLGALVVVLSGLRQLFRFHEEWISASQTRYAIEREIALFVAGHQKYQGPNATASLILTIEDIAAAEGARFAQRRERASELLEADQT
jgi:hypothetical protein